VNKVASHLLRLLQPPANPAPAEVFGTWQPSLRQHSDLAAMGWDIQKDGPGPP